MIKKKREIKIKKRTTFFPLNSSGSFRVAGSERENGFTHIERFPSTIEDEFDEIEEVKEEYINAPTFQRIHISGDETTGVSIPGWMQAKTRT